MTERRVAVRHESSQATPCHYATLERIDCRWASVHDVSKTGVALLMEAPFEVGTRVVIELPAATYQEIHPVSAQVIRTSDLPPGERGEEGRWLVGCEFVRELSDDEAARLR